MNIEPETAKGVVRRFVQVIIALLLQAAILFFASGRLSWIWAWVYLAIAFASLLINGTILLRTSPETIAERGRLSETEPWDKIVSGGWALALFVVVPLVAGIDVRFGWTQHLHPAWHPAWNVGGAVLLACGLGLAAWAMIANAYFSTAVRIQSDRGQKVCRAGPYRLVRHPGYLGFIMQSLGTPLTLGSLWALIPGITAAILMIIRTALEDRFLQLRLSGYREYTREVCHRLVPGMW
ncbi:MAG TPA: isoprenylcysteine carboxylmethyltransferase family protein [Chroococcidiopsis sp.]